MPAVADGEFREPRLAAVYDELDPDRRDLDEYERVVVEEFGAHSALDVGSGTGTLALRLAAQGLSVTGVDPAEASVDVARSKPGAEGVTWHLGTADRLPQIQVDAVTMTANVAQVFLTDEDFRTVLAATHQRLRPGGVLVFEARRPEDQAWERWTKDQRFTTTEVPGVGRVDTWSEVRIVNGELVTFAVPVVFHCDGARYDSISTLRFRTREAIEAAVTHAGFRVHDVRDLAYAPGRAWMYLAVKAYT